MKFLTTTVIALVFSSSALAAVIPGKYQLKLLNNLSGEGGTVQFLLNSSGEAKVLTETEGYYIKDFNVKTFFGIFDFNVEWGSDEDHHYYSFSLVKENGKVILAKSCSMYVDGPGGYHRLNATEMTLSRWSKKTKSYYEVNVEQSADAFESCQKELEKSFL